MCALQSVEDPQRGRTHNSMRNSVRISECMIQIFVTATDTLKRHARIARLILTAYRNRGTLLLPILTRPQRESSYKVANCEIA